jgi:hypothetical protein
MRGQGLILLTVWAVQGAVAVGQEAAAPTVASQQEPPTPLEAPPRRSEAASVPDARFLEVLLGYRTWISFGQSTISMAGSGGFPNIISELKWRRLFNPIQEVNAETIWGGRFIARFDVSAGTAGGGSFRDLDYDDNDRTSLASDTTHPANDNSIFYFNLDFGYRVWDLKSVSGRFTGDVLLGYEYWQEKYIASNGQELFPDPGPFPPGRVVSNNFKWNSFRIGGRTEIELARWTLGAKLMFVPVSNFRDDDIHYLRTDLLQDPSFIDQATGGFGVMLDATVSYRIWKSLSVEAGYRLWYNQAGMGLDYARTPQGDVVSPLHQVQTVRQGLLLGVYCRF